MKDYWNELDLPDMWNKRERFNFIMAYIDSKFDSSDSQDEDTPTPTPTPEPTPEPEPVDEKASLNITVSDNANAKLSGVNVSLTGDETYTGSTDKKGEVTISNIVYGEYTVSAELDGYESYNGTITIDSAEEVEDIVLSILTGDVKVTVTDGENPVDSAEVIINNTSFTGTTGSAGGCTIRNVPLGEYTIEASKEGYINSLEDLTVNVGENTILITLDLDVDDSI